MSSEGEIFEEKWFTFYITAKPNLSLENCPDEVEEDVQIRCICISSLYSSASLVWYNGPNVVYSEFNNILSFRAKIKLK
ncbi:hypothetical protein BgiBS90_019222, partial [Biomphalaria glabrata]